MRAEEIEVEDMEEKESGKKQPPSKGTSELVWQPADGFSHIEGV